MKNQLRRNRKLWELRDLGIRNFYFGFVNSKGENFPTEGFSWIMSSCLRFWVDLRLVAIAIGFFSFQSKPLL